MSSQKLQYFVLILQKHHVIEEDNEFGQSGIAVENWWFFRTFFDNFDF